MPLYAYKGISNAGKTVTGVKDAESPKMLRQLMRRDGVVVTDVSVSKGGKKTPEQAGAGLNKEVDLGSLLSGVKRKDIVAFTRQLATLLRSGIPLAEALTALFDQTENVRFKSILQEVKTAVNEGSSLGDAMAKHPKAFDDLYVSMCRAGEVSGNLDAVLERLSDFLEAGQALRSKVQGAMVYPLIMVLVGGVIMVILMTAVIPNIVTIFEQQDQALPWNTELLIWGSSVLGGYWYLWLVLTVAGIWLFVNWKKSEAGQPAWHGFVLKLPLFGPLIRKIAVARFARTLGTMLASGVAMLRALDVSKETLGNVILAKVVDDAREAISQGESLAVTLKRSGHFPAVMTHMIAVGERSGKLEEMLTRVADAFDRESENALNQMTKVLEPLMLVGMGLTVAFVVFSILQPIIEMSRQGMG